MFRRNPDCVISNFFFCFFLFHLPSFTNLALSAHQDNDSSSNDNGLQHILQHPRTSLPPHPLHPTTRPHQTPPTQPPHQHHLHPGVLAHTRPHPLHSFRTTLGVAPCSSSI